MGKELLKMPGFHEAIVSLDTIVQEESGFSAMEALEKGDMGGSDSI